MSNRTVEQIREELRELDNACNVAADLYDRLCDDYSRVRKEYFKKLKENKNV